MEQSPIENPTHEATVARLAMMKGKYRIIPILCLFSVLILLRSIGRRPVSVYRAPPSIEVGGVKIDTNPFIPGTERTGFAIYTVFCGANTNDANIVPGRILNTTRSFQIYGKTEEIHYFYATDNPETKLRSERAGWKVINLKGSPEADELDANYKCKLARCIPQLLPELGSFQYILYVDSKKIGGLDFSGLAIEFEKLRENGYAIIFNKHPWWTGVEKELSMALQQSRYKREERQYRKYIKDRLKRFGESDLLAGGFMLRDMNHVMNLIIGAAWYSEILTCGIQDQLSLAFVYQRYRPFIGLTERWLLPSSNVID